MNSKLARIDLVLARIERLAAGLRGDPDCHVLRSATELRVAFDGRDAMEPAVARVRQGVQMLRRGNHEGTRREFTRRAHGVDYLADVMELELLPELRRVGFNV